MAVQHVVLIGDSVFDNQAYTDGEPDVLACLRTQLHGWTATSLAVDGSRMRDLKAQLARVPAGATHLVLSIGGNDLLWTADELLNRRVSAMADALSFLAERVEEFETQYRTALASVLALQRPTMICTIYNGNFDSSIAAQVRVALSMFDDVIVRLAAEHGLRVLELRAVLTERADYTDRIEPSGQGGAKIAAAIAQALTGDRT